MTSWPPTMYTGHSRAWPSWACTCSLSELFCEAWRPSKAFLGSTVGLWELFSGPIPQFHQAQGSRGELYRNMFQESTGGRCWGPGIFLGPSCSLTLCWQGTWDGPAVGLKKLPAEGQGHGCCLSRDSHWMWPLPCVARSTHHRNAQQESSSSSPAPPACCMWRTWPRRRHCIPMPQRESWHLLGSLRAHILPPLHLPVHKKETHLPTLQEAYEHHPVLTVGRWLSVVCHHVALGAWSWEPSDSLPAGHWHFTSCSIEQPCGSQWGGASWHCLHSYWGCWCLSPERWRTPSRSQSRQAGVGHSAQGCSSRPATPDRGRDCFSHSFLIPKEEVEINHIPVKTTRFKTLHQTEAPVVPSG